MLKFFEDFSFNMREISLIFNLLILSTIIKLFYKLIRIYIYYYLRNTILIILYY